MISDEDLLQFQGDENTAKILAVEVENSPLVQKVTVLGTYSDITGKTITIRLSFSHPERTLTRDEVQAVVDGVVARLKGQGIELKK